MQKPPSLSDLVKAGVLRPDQKLVFRTAAGPDAQITAQGAIRFRGKDYTSPSGAAKVAAGGTSTNGWMAWYVKEGEGLTRLAKYRDHYTNANA